MTEAVEHGAKNAACHLVRLLISNPEGVEESGASLAILFELPAAHVPCCVLVLTRLIGEAGTDFDATVASNPRALQKAANVLAGELVVVRVAPYADVVAGREQHEPFALAGEALGIGKLLTFLDESSPLLCDIVEHGACCTHRFASQRCYLQPKVSPEAAHFAGECG